MNTNNRGFVRHLRQTGTNAVAARRATCDTPLAGGVGRRHDDDNTVAASGRGCHAPIKNSSIAKPFVLFRATETLPGAAGDNNRPYRFAIGWRRR
jgi:hypothetical protein